MTSVFLGNIKGPAGRGISSITKTASVGLVDTYTVTYTDNTTDTFNITNGADGIIETEITIEYGSFNDLAALINEAEDNDIIILEKNYKNNIEPEIIIDKNIIIIGNGFAIDGNNVSRAFNVNSGNLELYNMTIQNCSEIEGGAINVTNGSLTLVGVSFNNNTTTNGHGGAIKIGYNSNVYMNDCKFNSNNSIKEGANSLGGAICINDSNADILRTIFIHNQADEAGAIYIRNSDFNIQHSTFTSNNAIIKGGALSLYLISSIDMKNDIFENNKVNNSSSANTASIYAETQKTIYNCEYPRDTVYNIINEDYITDENLMTFMTELSNKITT